MSEIIEGLSTKTADLFIQTLGGMVDASEKLITLLGQRLDNYRVIVPSWAKSAGTVISLSSETILLGVNSELGPIDPQLRLPNIGFVPAEIVAKDPQQPYVVRQIAENAVKRTRSLAKRILERGMLSGKTDVEIEEALNKISSSTGYFSHGAVIDYSEATALGLKVEWIEPSSTLWKRIWLLYCMYDYDSKAKSYGKIFEGAKYSISRRAST